ncbi:dihydropyrimidinase [Pseudodesulfovibrio sediminis]|uniref:D-hydantoinase/dihydropyrimidinase n=1 Tax=Pseudodesulfovibrio sediminis TaxID=2810563 RepID=A0ABN6EVU1_9BACT|nr:dihydropyrimidinase [Pseudodesulfovibrio sediminis]BCS89580.1 D-hydantoinase/dihydropyrimidinase [Pseudodesulfovibrio sediminis]
MKTLIKNGMVVNADESRRADLMIQDGTILTVGTDLNPEQGCRVIDAQGLLVMPGGIDPHTHLEMPVGDIRTADGFENGGRAALSGGTTTIIDFVNPKRSQSYLEAFDQWKERAANATCNYSFHVTVTWLDEKAEQEIRLLAKDHGVNSFKHFTTYRDTIMLDPDKLLRSFSLARELGCLCTVHAENDEIIRYLQHKLLAKKITHPKGHVLSRPPIAEGEATNRAIALAKVAGVPLYIVHMSCAEALRAVITARESGQEVYAESLCGHLLLDESVYYHKDPEVAARYVMSPPYRSAEHRDALWDGFKAGHIQTTGSDNCTFTQAERNRGLHDFTKIPNGSPGLEDRMRIIWSEGVVSGRLTQEEFVAVTSTNAAKIFNIYPNKGVITPGADADIVLWDPEAQHTVSAATHMQAIDYSIFEGMTFTGSPHTTILGGEVVFAAGQVTALAGQGKYIARPARQRIPHCHS